MKISQITDPALFQRLVQRLYVAERGTEFQVVDDSGGDRGNDGYDRQRNILLSIYCPEKPASSDYLRKGRSDLDKAVQLSRQPGYQVREWWFVTPSEVREPAQAELRQKAEAAGLTATFVSSLHLEDLYLRHPHLHDQFAELQYPVVSAKLDEILGRLRAPDTTDPPARNASQSSRQATANTLGILDGFPSAELVGIAARIEAGDPSALGQVERYRMEAVNPKDVLSALLLELQFAQGRNDRARATHLASTGLQRARKVGFAAEQAVFAAHLAFEETMELVARDMNMVAQAGAAHITGMLLTSEKELRAEDAAISQLSKDVDELVEEAQSAAEKSDNLIALFVVLIRRGSIATQRHFPFTLSRHSGLAPTARVTILSLKNEMEGVYETAIRIAAALRDTQRLALAYGNYANDLVGFEDYARGKEHALHALELARSASDEMQVHKTGTLLDKIERESSAASTEA